MHFFLCLFALITIILNVCTAVDQSCDASNQDQSCDASNQGTNPADYPRANLRRLTLKDGPDPGGTVGCPAPGDPNALDAKHSYDILFADGTHLNGTSEPNVVEVTVQGLTFPLHISCSDPFPNGYGMKGGPVEGTPSSVATDTNGNVYMTCFNTNSKVFKFDVDGNSSTLTTVSLCNSPHQVTTDTRGNVYLACIKTDSTVFKFDQSGSSSSLNTTAPCTDPTTVAAGIDGKLYLTCSQESSLYLFCDPVFPTSAPTSTPTRVSTTIDE